MSVTLEAIPHNTEHAKPISELYQANEALAGPAMRRAHFASLDTDGFIDLLQRVSALIRSGEGIHLQSFDGESARLMGYEPPTQEDKEQLLRETWEVARGFLRDDKLSDEEALTYAGLSAAGGTLLIHPFMDANGRTSRVISHMIIRGSNENTRQELSQILDSNRLSPWYIAPLSNATLEYASEYDSHGLRIDDPVPEMDWHGDRQHTLDDREKDDPVRKLASNMFRGRAFHLFLQRADKSAREIIDQFTEVDEVTKSARIDMPAVLTTLVNDPDKGISYAAQLNEAGKWARADYVRRYLQSMQELKPRELPAHSSYAQRIRSHKDKSNPSLLARQEAFDQLRVGDKLTPRDFARVMFAGSGLLIK